jgi:HlyD family secretion protein
MRTAIALLLVLGLTAGGVAYYKTHQAASQPISFRTVAVKRGDLLSTISATGTVEPEELVDVGAQVVGRIKDLGVDPSELKGRKPAEIDPQELQKLKRVDYGTIVHKGTVLAYIDPQELKKLKRVDYGTIVHDGTELAYIDPAVYEAQLAQAEAALERAKADLVQFSAKRDQAAAEWQRAKRLRPDRAALEKDDASQEQDVLADTPRTESKPNSPSKPSSQIKAAPEPKATLNYRAMSDSDYDLAKANDRVAQANVLVGEKTIQQAQAALQLAQTNLNYTTIKSPVEGVIIDRRVNVGQTVVASLNAPSLFLIAKDLKKMQVWASVNEADIGRIHQGMPVRFTLDAFPGEVFHGKVAQIRLNATMTQNVVTYTVVVAFDNPDSKVLPYLTANLQFELEQRHNVLLVPNVALRWDPRPEQIALEARPAGGSASFGKGGGGAAPPVAESPGDTSPSTSAAQERQDRGRLWVKDGDFVRPIEVEIGATDGSLTEVRGDEVQEGMEVVTGEVRAEQVDETTTNPFGPPRFPRAAQKGAPPRP